MNANLSVLGSRGVGLVVTATALALAGCNRDPCQRLAAIITDCGDTYEEWMFESCEDTLHVECSAKDLTYVNGFYDCLTDAGLTECDATVDDAAWAVFNDCYVEELDHISEECAGAGISVGEF